MTGKWYTVSGGNELNNFWLFSTSVYSYDFITQNCRWWVGKLCSLELVITLPLLLPPLQYSCQLQHFSRLKEFTFTDSSQYSHWTLCAKYCFNKYHSKQDYIFWMSVLGDFPDPLSSLTGWINARWVQATKPVNDQALQGFFHSLIKVSAGNCWNSQENGANQKDMTGNRTRLQHPCLFVSCLKSPLSYAGKDAVWSLITCAPGYILLC